MTEEDIKTNFKLSADFNTYVFQNPGVLKVRGFSDSCVVFVDHEHPALSEKNLELGKKIAKEEKKKCFQAVKLKKGWRLELIPMQ